MREITEEMLAEYAAAYEKDRTAQTLTAALAKTGMADLAFVPANAAKLKGSFAIELKTGGITAQEKSGRCWMFAALNILREEAARKLNLEQFELSQNYITFYDKLEKANNFLELVMEYAAEPLPGQRMQYILQGLGDGGYWCQAVDLIEKYGVVPKTAGPESWQSGHTADLWNVLNRLLKKDAVELRALVRKGEREKAEDRKKQMLGEIYRAECIALGEPVRTFDFAWRDRDNNYHVERDLTPRTFYEKYIGHSLRDYEAVICEPVSGRKVGAPVVFHGLENMAGRDMRALNLPGEQLEELAVRQLRDGKPVWFACDAGAFGARKEGVWDPDSVRYDDLLLVDTDLPKKERLEMRASSATHAMVLTGVNFDRTGTPDRWKIENSWGEDVGDKGYFVCSEKYFREYVYEVVIDRKYFTQEQLGMLEREAVRIEPWEEE